MLSTNPRFFQFRGARGALKWKQLWQTGGAQGLCHNLVLCSAISRWEGSYYCCALMQRDPPSVGLSFHCLLPVLNRRAEFRCRTQLQRVACIVLKLRKIHSASRAEQLQVTTDICVSECLWPHSCFCFSSRSWWAFWRQRSCICVCAEFEEVCILWIRNWQAVTWNDQKRVLLCLILVSLVVLLLCWH